MAVIAYDKDERTKTEMKRQAGKRHSLFSDFHTRSDNTEVQGVCEGQRREMTICKLGLQKVKW